MLLAPDTRLNAYRILGPLGKGGMGEVYRADDTKLKREVAIKILPEAFARDEERLKRFEREAQMLASLNHPNIASIYGLEEDDGRLFLVLELVEGLTLAERIKQGPIPLEEALRIARQIAEALSEAHEKGIIHRDLKPANVKLTPEGQVKVLDFGLAKAFSGDTTEAGASSELSQSPTLSRQATAVGLILGTAAYMSPEQAKGKKVDRRTDVWAFGVVLYEMLTGTRLFDGEDVSDTLAAVLRAEPDWGALPAATPSAIRRLLRRALTKDRRERLGDIGDARLEIEEADGSPPENVADPSPSRRLPLTVTGPLLFAFGAVLAWSLARPDAGAPPTVTRYSITLPETVALDFNAGLAWSPDGKSLVYRANRDGVAQLFLRSRDQQDPIPIRATENGMSPFFSPDGQWIGFFDGESLKKVSVAGGPSVTLCPAGGRLGASWGPDDTIVFASSNAQGLMRVPAAGGEPTPLTDPAPDEGRHNWPEFLPDGRAVLFTISQQGPISDKQIAVLSLDSGETRILADGTDAGFASSGHLVFAREASLWAVAFDLESLDVTGTPAPVVEGVQVNSLGGWAGYALAADGSLAYRLGTVRSFGLDTVDRQGAATTLTDDRRNYGELRFSPDGRRVAVELEEDIWMLEVARGSLSRFTVEGGRDPVWTPDGTGVTYAVDENGIFLKPSDGSGEGESFARMEHRVRLGSWSPDGETLVIEVVNPTTLEDIWILPREGEPSPWLATPFRERRPELSPDGRWLIYLSDESGRTEVYLQPYPGPGQRVKVSTAGGLEPSWSRDGREIFYRRRGELLAVSFDAETEPPVGRPSRLIDGGPYRASGGTSRYYDVSPDGGHFAMLPLGMRSLRELRVVLNWFEELKERVPTE